MSDLSITPSSVVRGNATIGPRYFAAEAIDAGEVIVVNDSNKVVLASAADADLDDPDGIALNSAAVGQPVLYAILDSALEIGVALDPGTPIYLSETAGKMTATIADIATTGSTVVLLGASNGDTSISINCVSPLPFKATEVIA